MGSVFFFFFFFAVVLSHFTSDTCAYEAAMGGRRNKRMETKQQGRGGRGKDSSSLVLPFLTRKGIVILIYVGCIFFV